LGGVKNMNVEDTSPHWPQRSWGLAVAGAITGILVHVLIATDLRWQVTEVPWRLFLATFLVVAGLAAAFVVERARINQTAIFAGLSGLVVASIVYFNGGPQDWGSSEGLRLVCGALSVAIAAPLFQAWRDSQALDPVSRWHISYPVVHDRAWTNVVLWFAAWAFVGISWLLVLLLSELFNLIGLDFLQELIRKAGFGRVLTGAALGAAIGLLRDRERILGTLQRVVTTVLSVLSPILGGGLLFFLGALPFTGLTPLWDATSATTPILIACVIGALILSNATIGDTPEDEAKQPLLRWGAVALGAAILPLGIIAAISTGLRIGQYGLTPDRLWALVFTAIACAYGLAYAVALLRRRLAWAGDVRPANLKLAFALCGLAFLLSTPLISFNALSTRSQVARLEHGLVTPAKFDWSALRFDFGAPGKAAVERLAKSGATPAIKTAAADALKSDDRWRLRNKQEEAVTLDNLDARLTILPQKIALPEDLRKRLVNYEACGDEGKCAVFYTADATEVIVVHENCTNCDLESSHFGKGKKGWALDDDKAMSAAEVAATAAGAVEASDETEAATKTRRERQKAALAKGQVEIRQVTKRQVFVDGQPVADPF
jgi:Domain of unknown function (DUF4153)